MKSESETLELAERPSAALVPQSQDPVARSIAAMIDKGVTEANVAALERLCDLYEKLQAKDAEKQFAAAFVALQSELLPVEATKGVPNSDGTLRYKFAPYDEIMEQVRPLLQKHGFTVSFSMAFADGRVIQSCTLQHVGGHARTNQFAARVGKGPPGSSDAQGDGAASTYAKRFAFCNALNITIETENDGGSNDARAEGMPITPDKVRYLRDMIVETDSDEKRFLALAGVTKFEDITRGVYPVLVRALAAKRR